MFDEYVGEEGIEAGDWIIPREFPGWLVAAGARPAALRPCSGSGRWSRRYLRRDTCAPPEGKKTVTGGHGG